MLMKVFKEKGGGDVLCFCNKKPFSITAESLNPLQDQQFADSSNRQLL